MGQRSIIILLILTGHTVYCQIELLTEPLKYNDHPHTDVFIGERVIDLIPGANIPASEVPFNQGFYFKAIVPCETCKVKSVELRKLGSNHDIGVETTKPAKSKPDAMYNDLTYVGINWLHPASYYSLKITWEESATTTSPATVHEDVYSFSTIAKKFVDRSKQRLSAEFGVMTAGFKIEDRLRKEFSFCFTINYHILPVNKDVPIRNYGLLHPRRLSYVLGVTLNSMAESSLRSNLTGNSNLMLGLSYQPADMIKFSYGAMIFKDHNPNILLQHQTRLAATSYVAVTIDLDLKDLFAGGLAILGFK